jgi:hypothetical protein
VGDSEQCSNVVYQRDVKTSIVRCAGSQRSLDTLVKGGIIFVKLRGSRFWLEYTDCPDLRRLGGLFFCLSPLHSRVSITRSIG